MAIVSHAVCAQYALAIYDPLTQWDHYWIKDGVVLGHHENIVSLRGTADIRDWMADAVILPAWHPKLGACNAGFLSGMDDAFAEVASVVETPMVITGHSLGAARAYILAGLFAAYEKPVAQVTVFAPPRPAFAHLKDLLTKTPTEITAYRNRNDPVPLFHWLPDPFHPLVNLYEQPVQLIQVDAAPEEHNLEALRDHQMKLYESAMEKMCTIIKV